MAGCQILIRNRTKISCNCLEWGREGLRTREVRGDLTIYNISLIGTVTMNATYTTYSNKNFIKDNSGLWQDGTEA
jgi:hypothetical protein